MAAAFVPAGMEDDSDEDGGFMFGDEDYSDANSAFGSTDKFSPQIKTNVRGQGRSSSVELEDFRMAVIQGNVKAVAQALERGMEVNAEFSTGWTALMYAGNCARGEVFKLLLDKGANPNHQKDLYTVLMATCEASSQKGSVITDCVKLLLEKGADVNARDRYHVTALMCAAREGRLEVVQLLVDSGAEIDRQDSRGWTALSWATHREKLDVVKLLLERGADPSKKHCDNLTAVDLARGREEIVWLFEGKQLAGVAVGAGDAGGAAAAVQAAETGGQNKGSGEMRYGDLEMFLFGLELGQFLELFKLHHVDFPLLLTLDEEDLTKMGISQVGVRKKLLEAVAAIHKKNWETSSLVPIRVKSQVRCPDAIAIVANVSQQLRYISSSITYVSDHVRREPKFLAVSQESADPQQLLLHARDGLKNTVALHRQLVTLHATLAKELASTNYSPPDLLTMQLVKKRKLRYGPLAFTLAGATALTLLIWRRQYVEETVTTMSSRIRWLFVLLRIIT